MTNPFEPISATPLDTELSEALRCAKKAYRCPKCQKIFEISNYESLNVYYGVAPIQCDCCTAYSLNYLNEGSAHEVAWYCGNRCFLHDMGESPAEAGEEELGVEVGWMCTKKHLHDSESAAINC